MRLIPQAKRRRPIGREVAIRARSADASLIAAFDVANDCSAALSIRPVLKVTAILLSVALLCSGCTSIQVDHDPRVDLRALKRYFVVHRLADDRFIDETIVNQLRSMGYEASAGPLTMMPQAVDAIITYRDDWAWDFRTYLLQVEIEIHRAHTRQPLARGSYRQQSIITKTPPVVIERILTKLFQQP